MIDDLIQKLNAEVNIPFVSEAREEGIIRWLVEKIQPHIPEWVLALMASAADGLTMEELKPHEDVIVAEINKLVDLPATPEVIEERLIRFVVRGLLEYACSGNAMPA